MAAVYQTRFGSLKNFEKGHVVIVMPLSRRHADQVPKLDRGVACATAPAPPTLG